MKNLIIVGAGGMGRSVYCIAQECYGYGTEFKIKGFLNDKLDALSGFRDYPPIIGTIDGYEIQHDDVFVCSLGDTISKKLICDKLKKKGANFYTLIHKTAIFRKNAEIGEGCIIAPYASIGADCKIGCNTLLQSYAIVAHDCIIGNYVRIDTHSVCVGGVVIEDLATIHTGAVVSHNVIVGEGAVVAATSFVIRKVKPRTTVFGNPAKLL